MNEIPRLPQVRDVSDSTVMLAITLVGLGAAAGIIGLIKICAWVMS